MYIVVSKWQPSASDPNKWKDMSNKMKGIMDAMDGVEFSHRFENEDGQAVVVIGYRDEPTYKALVADDGALSRSMAENNVESVGTWVSSDRGEAL